MQKMTCGVLLICLGNSCRSIMAEAMARHVFPDSVQVGSAGINPLGFIADGTLEVLAEIGIPSNGLHSKGLSEINPSEFTVIVNLTTHPLDAYLSKDFPGRIIRHPVADPFGDSLTVYRQVWDDIHRFVSEVLPELLFHD